MHLKRLITGIIAVPILILLIGPGPRWAFYSIVYLVSLASLIEFYKITAPGLPKSLQICIYALTFLFFFLIARGSFFLAQGVFPFFASVPMVFFMLTYGRSAESNSRYL